MKATKLILSFLFLFLIQSAYCRNDSIVKPQVRYSPVQIANLKTSENNYVKCTYGQPLKKGRTVFGGIVPFGKLWRTGANEATEITFTSHVKIGEKYISAGTYSLFSIPDKNSWKIILNSVLGQWGDFTYDSTKNILEIDVPVQKNKNIYEGFTISFEDKTGGYDMLLMWDDVKVVVPIQIIQEIPIEKSNKKKTKKN